MWVRIYSQGVTEDSGKPVVVGENRWDPDLG